EQGLAVHLDGSRLMNAVVASGIQAREWCSAVSSVNISLTKGLGAPVGAVLAGSDEFIHEAARVRQRLGGAMRQAGIIAAGGLYALQHNVDRLAEDHENARLLHDLLSGMEELDVEPCETNMVYFGVEKTGMTAAGFAERLLQYGVRTQPTGERVRAVTHMDVTRGDIQAAADAAHRMLIDYRLAA
ncbi:MAG: threonine aldolase family protein, partial [Armatimonadota bacterium]